MMKRFIIGLLAGALILVTGFFMVIGVLGATFAGACLSSDASQLVGKDNQAKIYNFWIRNGFSPAQAAGITASIQHESGYSPFRQETTYSWPHGGYGIAQFTGGQRRAVTEYMATNIGSDFSAYYIASYGGAVSAENGFVPEGVPLEVNDKFLSAQLGYLQEYISSFKPSSINIRVSRFEAFTGLSVPRDATLGEYLLSLGSAEDAAKAWTFLYEYPGNINSTASARAESAAALFTRISGSNAGDGDDAGFLRGSCGVGSVVAPVDGEHLIVTSGAAIRTRSSGLTRMHEGIDIIGGETIVAAMDGTVIIARNNYGGYGTTVKIDHGNGTYTLYGHMVEDSLTVKVGDSVKAGQPLGTMGNTGDSEGVHLHFQVWIEDKLVNPFPFLTEQGVELTWQDGAYPINTQPGPLYDR